MPSVYVNIKPEIINWVLNQIQDDILEENMINNIKAWLNGTKTPTFNQIEDLSRKTNIPLGYFFLQTPPEEKIDLLEYRTIDSIQLAKPSRNLIDTIYHMERIRDWMKDYRLEMGFDILPVVGCMENVDDISTITKRIRNDLELNETWYELCSNTREAFNFIRDRLEACGIIVMMSGIVGSNTHRLLDINEFRAFVMVDKWAPIIFINATDSDGARLFSLLHEAVHIWIGKDDLFNDRYDITNGVSSTEKLCNAVTAELMVPKDIFINKWNEINETDVFDTITRLAKYFRCGEVVIARRAKDCNKINQDVYNHVVETAIENYNKIKEKQEDNGGNYYNTMISRLDGCFVRALCESINIGRTSYTEAYRLTNTSPKTFAEVAQRLGGMLW
ncbi:Zn-dependent peptidase ImmA (M78 family) [Herbinix hemicellulosilytica]|uniref:IrrE N-terminal-like domain-containing protein n=1 Tax=Herbinix hemicellulosilytica TaxID=1564487 RepID=A0A0H5SJ07_HERHM|nr:ImmA/IrrE family metallo-endopeptidase [Herbinix hemicellulosilytica]RBP58485.1 Zn-dependent peptidase ImmA (M78 family) [Herbinix hemicellulosilytica]CRZ35050.1 hypothetical protein HHT355_1850 [Herbinix hemicellulosilytica]